MVSDHIEAIKSGTTGEEPCGGRPRRPMRAMLERLGKKLEWGWAGCCPPRLGRAGVEKNRSMVKPRPTEPMFIYDGGPVFDPSPDATKELLTPLTFNYFIMLLKYI